MAVLVELVDTPIDVARWQAALGDSNFLPEVWPDVGAEVWLYGRTRRHTRIPTSPEQPSSVGDRRDHATGGASVGEPPGGSVERDVSATTLRKTESLYYEAHRSMALKELRRIAGEAVEHFGVAGVVIVHRLGHVSVRQMSVAVGCGSAHRRPAIEAVAWIMDAIKRDVPIWKRETFADGRVEWVHPTG